MKINFIGVLTKPLNFKIIFVLIFNLFLLFLPAVLAANFLGMQNFIFHIVFGLGLIIASGYLWYIFQHEMEEDSDTFPKWNFVNCFFIGLKGIIFTLACVVLLAAVLFVLWITAQHFPEHQNFAYIAAFVWFIYWFLLFYVVAMGIFSENFNPVEALNFSTIAEVVNASWIDYFIASFYMILYLCIIGLIGWGFTIFFPPQAYNYIVVGFSVYAIIVYFSLYAKVFRKVRSEFESHI